MTSDLEQSPELAQAQDHIEALKRSQNAPGVCAQHAAQVQATIWIIYHIALLLKRERPTVTIGGVAIAGPCAVVIMGLLTVWKAKGWM